MSERGRWVVYFETGTERTGIRRRYLMNRGWRKFKGMYRNRRPVGYEHATWTDDIEKAARFHSPSAAKRSKATIVPARWDRMHFEKLPEKEKADV